MWHCQQELTQNQRTWKVLGFTFVYCGGGGSIGSWSTQQNGPKWSQNNRTTATKTVPLKNGRVWSFSGTVVVRCVLRAQQRKWGLCDLVNSHSVVCSFGRVLAANTTCVRRVLTVRWTPTHFWQLGVPKVYFTVRKDLTQPAVCSSLCVDVTQCTVRACIVYVHFVWKYHHTIIIPLTRLTAHIVHTDPALCASNNFCYLIYILHTPLLGFRVLFIYLKLWFGSLLWEWTLLDN